MRLPVILLLVLSAAWCTRSSARCGGCVETRCGECVCTTLPDGCITADCTGINTTDVPGAVPNNTCVLIIKDTSIDSISNFTFRRLTNLTSLDLSSNAIQNISDFAFAGLTKLVYLNLSQNNLDFNVGNVKLHAFDPLVHLQALELEGNTYESYPDKYLTKLKSLENLTLDGLDKPFGTEFSKLGNLTYLDLSGHTGSPTCKIKNLTAGMFQNVSRLRYLNISNCKINKVNKYTLSPLTELEILDVSFNQYLSFEGFGILTNGLKDSNLRQLFMTNIVRPKAVCVQVKKDEFINLQNTKLELLDVSDNRIEVVETLEALPKSLTTIIARINRFSQGNYSTQLHLLGNLTFMDLSGEKVSKTLFQFLSDSSESLPESGGCEEDNSCRLKDPKPRIVVSSNRQRGVRLYQEDGLSNRTWVHLPPNLQNITYTYAELNYQLGDIYIAENSLKHIDLSYNVLTMWPGPVIGVENVTYLDLSNNFAHYVNFSFFANFTSLKFLNLSFNFLSHSIYKDDKGDIFRHQSKLEILDLSNNDLLELPYHFIEGLSELRVLNITNNIINSLALNFTSNTKLKFINMSDNSISFLPRDLRNILDKLALATNLSMDLAWNPFQCTCEPEHMDFLDWLYTTSKVRFVNMHRYMCVVFKDNRRRFKRASNIYERLQNNCKVYIALAMGLLSVVVLFTTIIICGIIYRYRWRLTYIYYVGKRRWKKKQNYEQIYDFDAFVSYADADLEFVRPLMLSRLESDQGLNLYIRHRESIPGDSIAESIIEAIQRSRKCVVLISQASLLKKWCRYELQMANVQGITSKKSVLIIVLLESVPTNRIPREIMYYLKTKPPLQYPGQDSAQTSMFWESLAEEIRS